MDNVKQKKCTACGNYVKNIDIDRIMMRLDKLFSRHDFDEAERLLQFWINEAKNSNDLRSELSLQNEFMGYCRKLGRHDEATEHANRAYELMNQIGIANTISGATILINIGTVYKAQDKADKAIEYFDKAKELYEKHLNRDDKKFAALYNNMALVLVDLMRYEEAKLMYEKAITIMLSIEGGQLDAAISYLNMADLIYKVTGNNENECNSLVLKAWELIDSYQNKNDDYYKFVCEKSAPSFGFYGYFIYENELINRSK